MGGRRRAAVSPKKKTERAARLALGAPEPLLYTAQDVAHFCEVDLKTIHHWADAGKIAHHRTEGRHLRFRRNHVVQFLRAHGYPLPAVLATVRPTIHYATRGEQDDEIVKKLQPRFWIRRYDDAVVAIANLVAGAPDALVLSVEDATFAGAPAVAALRSRPETSWPVLVLVAPAPDDPRAAGADLVLAPHDLGRLGPELARLLGVIT